MKRYSHKPLKEIPEDLRPREKLKRYGEEFLSEEELLAILLRTGTKKVSVLELARRIVDIGWDRLRKMSVDEIKELCGVGDVKAVEIKAIIELSRRIRAELFEEKVFNPEDVYRAVKDMFNPRKETLIAVYLDLGNRILKKEVMAVGSMNGVLSQPKDILLPAVELSAYGLIVAHNHPYGDCEPSQEDLMFTDRLKRACELLGFELIDHIIVSEKGFLSFKERGYL